MNFFTKYFNTYFHRIVIDILEGQTEIKRLALISCDQSQMVGLEKLYKQHSLTIKCIEENSLSKNEDTMSYDVVLCLFKLSHKDKEGQKRIVLQMQNLAPKAIFVDYELVERNMGYPLYFTLIFIEYLKLLLKVSSSSNSLKNKYKNKRIVFQEYLKNGALEGFIYDLHIELKSPPTKIIRKSLAVGGLGLFFCKW